MSFDQTPHKALGEFWQSFSSYGDGGGNGGRLLLVQQFGVGVETRHVDTRMQVPFGLRAGIGSEMINLPLRVCVEWACY